MTSKSKKHIAVFIDWFKPGYKAGGPITSCANMVNLLQDEFSFSIITRDRDYMEEEPYESVVSGNWTNYSANCEVLYVAPKNLNKEYFKSQLAQREIDCVYVNGIFSKHFSMSPLKLFRDTRLVLAPRGMLRKSALSIKPLKKRLYLLLSRNRKTYHNVIFQATTEDEAKDIARQKLGGDIRLAHNCPKIINPSKKSVKKKGALTLCFIGRVAKEKNLLFALRVLEGLELDNLQLNIVGEIYDQTYWNECEESIRALSNKVKVKMLGSLPPENLQIELNKANLFFLPTLGENYGHAIYESLASGTPVLISDQTPWRNLKNEYAGIDLPLKNRRHFLEAIRFFWEMEDIEYIKWTNGAIEFARKKVDFNKIKSEYIRLFK